MLFFQLCEEVFVILDINLLTVDYLLKFGVAFELLVLLLSQTFDLLLLRHDGCSVSFKFLVQNLHFIDLYRLIISFHILTEFKVSEVLLQKGLQASDSGRDIFSFGAA